MKNAHVPLEALLDATKGSIYKLTLLVAKRALQLADGEKPLVERPDDKALNNALREIAEGKISAKEKK